VCPQAGLTPHLTAAAAAVRAAGCSGTSPANLHGEGSV
jgi:hypothetical protein